MTMVVPMTVIKFRQPTPRIARLVSDQQHGMHVRFEHDAREGTFESLPLYADLIAAKRMGDRNGASNGLCDHVGRAIAERVEGEHDDVIANARPAVDDVSRELTHRSLLLGPERFHVVAASEARREKAGFECFIFGVKCGGSDATSGVASNAAVGEAVDRIIEAGGTAIFYETTELLGAEHILARRAVNDEVANRLYRAVRQNEEMAMAAGIDLLGVNPVPDNIKGGITTIEEKSLGAILKAGTAPIQDVIAYGERPTRPGLYFMDSPSAASEVVTGLSAAGLR
jgi:hypothetical protein